MRWAWIARYTTHRHLSAVQRAHRCLEHGDHGGQIAEQRVSDTAHVAYARAHTAAQPASPVRAAPAAAAVHTEHFAVVAQRVGADKRSLEQRGRHGLHGLPP